MPHPMLEQFNNYIAKHPTLAQCEHCKIHWSEPEVVILDKRAPDGTLDIIYQYCPKCFRVQILSGELLTR